MTGNVLVLIHGITLEPEPASQEPLYDAFWERLREARPELDETVDRVVKVEWGHHADPSRQPRPDERLTRASRNVRRRVAWKSVRRDDHPNNVLLEGFLGGDHGWPGLRQLAVRTRESAMIFGVSDIAYYYAPEGEGHVRRRVFGLVTAALDELLEGHQEVRLHLFCHSLGVTIAHDFLYGLFRRQGTSDFLGQSDDEEVSRQFRRLRELADAGRLKLGSLAAAASQLPVTIMRKQSLVTRLYEDGHLDPAEIGVRGEGIRVKFFYDVDDILGFPSRRLYSPDDAIADVQVDCGDNPLSAHSGYWSDGKVIEETAELIARHGRAARS